MTDVIEYIAKLTGNDRPYSVHRIVEEKRRMFVSA